MSAEQPWSRDWGLDSVEGRRWFPETPMVGGRSPALSSAALASEAAATAGATAGGAAGAAAAAKVEAESMSPGGEAPEGLLPTVACASDEDDKTSVPKSEDTLVIDRREITQFGFPEPSVFLPFKNWKEPGVEQYGGRAIGGSGANAPRVRAVDEITALILHDTSAWTWSPLAVDTKTVKKFLSVHFHVEQSGAVRQHDDLIAVCNHELPNNVISIGVEHIGVPWIAASESTSGSGLRECDWIDTNLRPVDTNTAVKLCVPPAAQLQASADLIRWLLLPRVGLTQLERTWPQILSGKLVNGKPVLDQNDASKHWFCPYCGPGNPQAGVCEDILGLAGTFGVLSHGGARREGQGKGKSDGMAYALYSWLHLGRSMSPEAARDAMCTIYSRPSISHTTPRKVTLQLFDVSEYA